MNKFYKEAARRVAEKETRFSCLAIGDVARDAGLVHISALANIYSEKFGPSGCGFLIPEHFEGCGKETIKNLEKARNHRVMALLFMAEACGDL